MDGRPLAVVIEAGEPRPEENERPALTLTVGAGESSVSWDRGDMTPWLSRGDHRNDGLDVQVTYTNQPSWLPAWTLIPAKHAREAARQFFHTGGHQPGNIRWDTLKPHT